MVRLCGAALGFLAFTIAVLLGLWSNNPFEVILTRALWAMVGFFALGLATGWVAWRVLDEHALKRDQELQEEFRKARETADEQADADARQTESSNRSPVHSGQESDDVLMDAAPVQ